MRTSELTGPLLDYWTAKALKWTDDRPQEFQVRDLNGKPWICGGAHGVSPEDTWAPSRRWSQCGPLIEEFGVSVSRYQDGWAGAMEGSWEEGPTPQIAICRAVVASVFGEEVEDA